MDILLMVLEIGCQPKFFRAAVALERSVKLMLGLDMFIQIASILESLFTMGTLVVSPPVFYRDVQMLHSLMSLQ